MKNFMIYLSILMISNIYAQCDDYSQLQCSNDNSCEWIENIIYGSCGNLAWQVCGNYPGCWVDSNPGWYDNSGPYCTGGSYQIDNSYCQESTCDESWEFQCNDGSCIPSVRVCNGVDDCIDGFDEIDCDCSEMNEPQCNQYGDCDWVVDSINCSSLTTEFSCNSNGCDWNINIDSYGCSQFDNNPSQCSQTYGCNWTWCAAQWEDCCSGWWQIDNSYCYGESGYCEENLYESGDINQDGSIDIGDIILTVGFILDGQYNNSADLDSNDIVNILDIILIIHIILN